MPETLATGLQLAQRLSDFIPALAAGTIPRIAGVAISRGLDRAEEKIRRQALIRAILDLLDPDRVMSINALSELMDDRLQRLQRALPNLRSGRRQPSELESLLLAWIDAGGPESARRIRDALIEALGE